MRVCLVYDCLYPHTVGGAERWYRSLGERLAADGHDVSYVTLRQWTRGTEPDAPRGVQVVVAGPRMRLYGADGSRRVAPPLVFGIGMLWHLLRHGRRYDVVHTASFPYFSLLAAGAVQPLGRFRLVVDWHELWSHSYWITYLGRAGGRVGWEVQRACLRVPQRAFCFSRLVARRLRENGVRGPVTVLEGEYDGPLEPHVSPSTPTIVFAGRHIPEKRVLLLVEAFALIARERPELRLEILGDGPERPKVLRRIDELGLADRVSAPGFVARERVDSALATASCMVLPSSREGYGLVVVEAAAVGTPSVVLASEDNAATELVEDGVNGVVAREPTPDALAAAIARVADAGPALRDSTASWFARNADRLALSSSLGVVSASYGAAPPAPRARP